MYFPYHRDHCSVNKPLLSTFVFSIAVLLFAIGLAFPSVYAVASGQPQGSSPAAPPVLTIDAIRERMDIVNNAPNLSPEAKEKIISFYQMAIDSLRRREKAISNADEYAEALKKAPEPGRLAGKAIPPVRAAAIEQRARAMALTEIEGEIARFQAQLAQEQTELELAKNKLNDTVGRPAALRRTIAAYGHKLADLEKRLAQPKPSDESPRVIRAKRISLRAKKNALKAELAAAEKHADLSKRQMLAAQNQQALTARKVNRLEALIKTWKEVREERQTDVGFIEFRQSTAVLEQMDKKTWPKKGDFLRKLAERNLAISKTLIELGEKESDALKTKKLLDTRLTQIKRDFEFTKNRIKLTGLSRKSGQLLQSRRSTLLTSRADSGVAQKRRNEMLNASLANDDLLQERQNFLVFKGKIYNQLDNIDADLTQSQSNILSTQAFLMLESYRKLLEETGKAYNKYLKTLNSQETAQKKIDALSKEYRSYINQRLLWTMSADPLSPGGISHSGGALTWLTSWSNWRQIAGDFKLSIKQNPSIWGILLLALLVSPFLLPWFRRRVSAIDKHVGEMGVDSIGKTFAAMLLTLLKTAWVPLIIYLSANHLWHLPAAHNFTRALCSGILSTAETVILIGLIIQLCRPQGIGRIHFEWSESACELVERSVKLLLFIFVPILLFVVIIQNGPQQLGYRNTLGRMLFILAMIPMVFVLARTLKTGSPLMEAMGKNRPEGRLKKYRSVWSSAIIAIPIVFIILSLIGYYFTAYEIGANFGTTLWLLLILVTADTLMRRGLHLAQVKIAL